MHAPDVHGESGLDGTDLLPEPECPVADGSAVDAMVAALSAQPKDTAWIVATGSMTNVGDLIRRHKSLVVDHVKGVSIMGGSFGAGFSGAPLGRVDNAERIGNITEWAEFNILIDPEAANEVFGDQAIAAKTTVVPLDLSHQVRATGDVRRALLFGTDPKHAAVPEATTGKTTLRTMLVELLYFFAKTYA